MEDTLRNKVSEMEIVTQPGRVEGVSRKTRPQGQKSQKQQLRKMNFTW